MMKERLQGIVIGFLVAIIATSTVVYAATGESTAKIFYNNIKVYVDGAEVVPKDGNGKVVEPFIMNGTTYLPVRAVATAFEKDVVWDGATQSVYLGKKDQNKPDNYLDRIQYSDFVVGSSRNKLTKINYTFADFSNVDYTNGMLFFIGDVSYSNSITDDTDKANSKIVYPLNSQYKKLSGKIVLPKSFRGENNVFAGAAKSATVYFYGDGELLHTANSVTGSMPFNFDLNVSGVNSLEIKIKSPDFNTYIALSDLALYK